MVGGTSIGSLVGALFAKYRNVETMNVHMKDFCKRMSSLFTKILDITYPITGMDNSILPNGNCYSKNIEELLSIKQNSLF